MDRVETFSGVAGARQWRIWGRKAAFLGLPPPRRVNVAVEGGRPRGAVVPSDRDQTDGSGGVGLRCLPGQPSAQVVCSRVELIESEQVNWARTLRTLSAGIYHSLHNYYVF
jgi:hypothetical protein